MWLRLYKIRSDLNLQTTYSSRATAMVVQISIQRIEVPPGQRVLLLEADNCFYFQNEARVRGRLDINLTQDPPPDLALEIDVTSKSLERFPIYARLGIPELWCYDAGTLTIYHLQSGHYDEVERSTIFPKLNIRALPQLIEDNRSAGRLTLRRSVRAWVRRQVEA
ncbi:MAG: hypothetical protein Kow00121_43320 [Elainellaceae cyanobacterium]